MLIHAALWHLRRHRMTIYQVAVPNGSAKNSGQQKDIRFITVSWLELQVYQKYQCNTHIDIYNRYLLQT